MERITRKRLAFDARHRLGGHLVLALCVILAGAVYWPSFPWLLTSASEPVPNFSPASSGGSAVRLTSEGGQPSGEEALPRTNPEGPIPTRSLWSILREGGPLMIPIGICSLVLVAVVLERLTMLRRGRVIPRPFSQRFVQRLRLGELTQGEALEICLQNGSPAALVFAGAIRKWGRPTVEIEQGALDAGERVAAELRRNLRILNGVATVSPLLGLLGTVVGMIHAFNAVATADALGRPELLAKGISQALLTTAAGLTVAIPALLAYLYFAGRCERLLAEIDGLAQEVISAIATDSPSLEREKPKRSRAKKSAACAEQPQPASSGHAA